MKLLLVVVALIALALADRDLSKFAPKARVAFPGVPPTAMPKIVNGKETERHQFPYMDALFIDGSGFCGGSIILANKVLTAAHCCFSANSIEVVVGGHNIQQFEESQQAILSEKKAHENWDAWTISNDVCVVSLSEPINIDGQTTATVSLYNGDDSLENREAIVSGWGIPDDSAESISLVLRYTSDTIMSNDDCKMSYNILKDSNICLNGENGRSACIGDSGVPLVVGDEAVGVFSFGSAWGCSIGFPSAYARVSSFHDWITARV